MLVSDVIEFAIHSEVKQLFVSKVSDSDCDQNENIGVLIGYINRAVIEIYKRLALRKETQLLTSVTDGAVYTMNSNYLYLYYAESNQPDKSDNVEIPINNEWSIMSVFEYSPLELTFAKDPDNLPCPDITEVNIHFVAAPVALLTAETDTVPLGQQYLDAILQFMAYVSHSGLTATPSEDNSTYFQRFETTILRLRKDGLITPDNQSNYKLSCRGYA